MLNLESQSKWIMGKFLGYRFSSKLGYNKEILNINVRDKKGIDKLFYDGSWIIKPKGTSKIVYYILKSLLPKIV